MKVFILVQFNLGVIFCMVRDRLTNNCNKPHFVLLLYLVRTMVPTWHGRPGCASHHESDCRSRTFVPAQTLSSGSCAQYPFPRGHPSHTEGWMPGSPFCIRGLWPLLYLKGVAKALISFSLHLVSSYSSCSSFSSAPLFHVFLDLFHVS